MYNKIDNNLFIFNQSKSYIFSIEFFSAIQKTLGKFLRELYQNILKIKCANFRRKCCIYKIETKIKRIALALKKENQNHKRHKI